jgi:hypothetical protein
MTQNRRKPTVCGKQIWRRQTSREFVFDRIGRGREVSETFPKPATYCHLLPFWSGKIATSISIVPFPTLPKEGMPASLGPG